MKDNEFENGNSIDHNEGPDKDKFSDLDEMLGLTGLEAKDSSESSDKATLPEDSAGEEEPEQEAGPVISEEVYEEEPYVDESSVIQEQPVRKAEKPAKKKRKKKKKVRFNGSIFGGIILVTVILTVSMVLAVSGIALGMEYYGIGKSDNMISFNIPEGADNEEIADLLLENDIIKNKRLFMFAIRWVSPDTIYPGDITLQPAMGYQKIIEEMETQRELYETVTITFTEGEYLIDIAQKLEDNGVCNANDFMFNFNKDQGYDFESYLTDIDNVLYDREGYFFPDTYEFYVNDTPFNITKILREHYNSKITSSMYSKMNQMGLTLNQTITLASIVQLEAASVEEMPRIASVFLNRLHDPDTFPRMETDTTYRYINDVIRKNAGSDESVQHYIEYYDSYAMTGLPAGPICNPGLDAINAVLNPAKTDYYYFCNDLTTGETFYAATLEEHEQNQIKAGLMDPVVDDEPYEDEDEGEEENDENYDEDQDENYDENYW